MRQMRDIDMAADSEFIPVNAATKRLHDAGFTVTKADAKLNYERGGLSGSLSISRDALVDGRHVARLEVR